MSNQDDTVLLEPEATINHVQRHLNEKQVDDQGNMNVDYRRRIAIQSFPYILFFISICLLTIYILFYRA